MLTKFRNKTYDKGFTLIELLIVIAIIGILAAIAVPIFLSQAENANEAAAQSQASALSTLVAGNLSVNGTVTGATGSSATTYIATGVGQVTLSDGTLAVTGTTENNYCAAVTVGADATADPPIAGVTAAYGPGANTANTGCQNPLPAP